jgi:hypothetical protein
MVVEDVQIDANKQGPQTEKNVKGVFNNIQNFLEKIIKFVKEALNNFIEGISNSMSSADEWYAANAKYLDNIPTEVLNSLTLTVIPYWETTAGYQHLQETGYPMKPDNIEAVLNGLEAKKNPDQSGLTDEQVYSTYFPNLAKLDPEPRKAALQYYEGVFNKTGESDNDNLTPSEKSYSKAEAVAPIEAMKKFFTIYKQILSKTEAAVKNNEKQMEAISARMKNMGVNTEGADFRFGYDLYSEVGECYLTDFIDVVDKYGNPARESILEVTSVMESGNGGGITQNIAGQGTAPANDGGTTGGTGNGSEQKTDQSKPQPNAVDAEKKKAERKAKVEAKQAEKNDANYKQVNKVFQICATIGTSRMTAFNHIASHYVTTLQQLVAGIKKYQGIQDEDKENKAYNERQEKREEMQHKDNLNEIRRNREKVIAAKKGFFTRWASRLFGK